MSRMSYFNEDETIEVANKLREEKFPCDVLHLDTGWFESDWKCDWTFGKTNFPNPKSYIQDMLNNGFRITLWQLPFVPEGIPLYKEAVEKGYLVLNKESSALQSDFSGGSYGGIIDFSNPDAVEWYKEMINKLIALGVAAIKTDFGEDIYMNGEYKNFPAGKLHNLYALLYQKSAFEATKKVSGEAIIWARAAWTGCQRYPIHWGGDAASSFDGMAGTLRGGLHFGLSGFGFWSHDVPGFYGTPDFMNTKSDEILYVRWTQMGVFSSHFRYHGTNPREPYNYPNVKDIIREWFTLRYALIPYIEQQAKAVCESGDTILKALIFEYPNDMQCWHIDDQYMFGNAFLVAPIFNYESVRNVYLPKGDWVDFWTGEILEGGKWIYNVQKSLSRMPLYVKYGSELPFYPESVQHTNEMNNDKIINIVFDKAYKGISNSILGKIIKL